MAIPYGSEAHAALRLQYEASTPQQRVNMSQMWTGSPTSSITEIIDEINRTAPPACPDCGAERGTDHALGCDVEECATCGLQLIGCTHG